MQVACRMRLTYIKGWANFYEIVSFQAYPDHADFDWRICPCCWNYYGTNFQKFEYEGARGEHGS